MKSFFKSKNFLIIIIALLLVALIIMVILLFRKSNNQTNKGNNMVSDYVAYVKINPSIKLQYSQTCNDKNECTDPIVTNYELINDDAKNIYKDIDLVKNGKDLINVLDLITQTAKDNDINFETVEIYSDWNSIDKYVEEKANKNDNWNFSVKVSNQEELNNLSQQLETNYNANNKDDESNNNNNTSNNNQTNTNETNKSQNNNTSEKELKEWTNIGGDFYYNGESEGYGDYIKGEHVCISSDYCYRWFKFVDTSKLGCKDAIDKQACKTAWLNYFEPKVAETKKDMDNARKNLEDIKALQERDKKSLEETKNQLQQCENAEINACKPGEYSLRDEMLTELKNQVAAWEQQVKTYDSTIWESELTLKAETNDYNEHLKALNIYKSL